MSGWGADQITDSNFVIGLYVVISIVGITGNLLVAIVLLRAPSLRTNTSVFLVHLSLVDLTVCILVIPYNLTPQLGNASPLSGFWADVRCKLYVGEYPFWVCALVSVFSLVTVNLERFVAIGYPHKYKEIFTKRNKCLMIVSCWILGALSKSFILFLYTVEEVGCRFVSWPSLVVKAVVGFYTFLVNFFVPFVVMIATQCTVISKLRRQTRQLSSRITSLNNHPDAHYKVWQLRTTNNLVRTLRAFAVTFTVCWAPNQLIFLLFNFGCPVDFKAPLYHFSVILNVCNSCVNPVIYAVMNRRFRNGLRELAFGPARGLRVGPVSANNDSTLADENGTDL